MKSAVEGQRLIQRDGNTGRAVAEWGAGVAVGAVPFLAHVLVAIADPRAPVRWEDWCGELLFIVIAMCGTAILSVIIEVARRREISPHLGVRCLLLTLGSLLFLIGAAIIYGILAAEQAAPITIALSVGMLLGAFMTSLALEVLLNEIALLEKTTALNIPSLAPQAAV